MAGIRYGDKLKTRCLGSLLDFTRFSFHTKENGKKFLVGRHHRIICEALDKVIRGETKRLIINIAPRYGKTELAVKSFIEYGLCLNPESKFLHLSYSDDLVLDSSREIRETLQEPTMQALFGVNIVSKNNKKWYTDKGGGLYAVSTGGQVTGFGAGKVDYEDVDLKSIDEFIPYYDSKFAGAIVIDDPIKPEDALSDNLREKVNQRFETTIRNRVNSRNTPIIIIMQRLHEHDLCGYLMATEPDEWTVISLPCIYYDTNGKECALWEEKHTLDELKDLERIQPFVFETQYMQNPKPLEGLMYRDFKTYDVIPECPAVKRCKCNYTDTADTGADYLCSICYDELPDGNYVTDVLYSKKPMEYTEQAMAQMLAKRQTEVCFIESNNGGRGFRRNVERITREYGNTRTYFVDFTQTQNKQARIFIHSNDVNNMLIFPSDWEKRWPEFANAVKSYRKEGRNAHDDAPDALTGTFEKRGECGIYANPISDEDLLKDFL